MPNHGVCNHPKRQLCHPLNQLLRRAQGADFNVVQTQTGLDRRQNHRKELLKPMYDEVPARENRQKPQALSAHGADRCRKVACCIHHPSDQYLLAARLSETAAPHITQRGRATTKKQLPQRHEDHELDK